MKIIIAGAGEVGVHLSKMLSREKYDIILIDENRERIEAIDSNLDIQTQVGTPTSLTTLESIHVKEADLFVCVTPDESQNITACMLAAKLGAKKTIARINNYEYLLPKNKEFFTNMGVSSLIYPEMLAAKEIVSALETPWARQWWEISDGALIMVGIKIRKNAAILDTPLKDIRTDDHLFHIVLIKRGLETLIPNGNDIIQDGDIVYFTTNRKNIDYVRTLSGKTLNEIKTVLFIGASRIAIKTIQLLPHNINIKVVEQDKERCMRMLDYVSNNVMVLHGDGRDMEMVEHERLTQVDAIVSLTGNAESNILSCLAAKQLGVVKSVAEVENIDYISLAENLDIGTVINKKLIAASHIYQHLMGVDVSNVKCLTFAKADVAELIAQKGSKITRSLVKDLNLPKEMTIGGVIRRGEGIIVTGNTQIQENDHVVVCCIGSMIQKLDKYFS